MPNPIREDYGINVLAFELEFRTVIITLDTFTTSQEN
jgi:hypothetical protein